MKNNHQNKNKQSQAGIGIIIGAPLGYTLGLLFFDGNIALGIGIGMAAGLFISSLIAYANQSEDER